MKAILDTRIMLAFHAVTLVALIVIGVYVYESKVETHTKRLAELVAEQEKELKEIALLTNNNRADGVIGKIIADCKTRPEFETLLGSLGNLEHKDILRVQQLYDACGDFFAERKAFMVYRMERELAIYDEYLAQHESFSPDSVYADVQATWHNLFELESVRRDLLIEQSTIQKEIITKLLQGLAAGHTEVQQLSRRGLEIGELLSVTSLQIKDIHLELSLDAYDS